MRQFLLIPLIAFALYCKAQSVEMLPLGSSQTGFFQKTFGLESGFRSISVNTLETIQGKMAKRLDTDYALGPAPRWIYQSGDSIFGHNGAATNWYFLFKNNFTLGEITTIRSNAAEITAIDTIQTGGVSMRRFTVKILSVNSPYRYIYDKAGPENGFLEWCGGACDQSAFWMCSYEDNEISPGTLPDNYCSLYLSATNPNTAEQPKLYPNPAQETINVFWGTENLPEEVVISDLNGKILLTATTQNHSDHIDISLLKPGVYLVRRGRLVFKLIKI